MSSEPTIAEALRVVADVADLAPSAKQLGIGEVRLVELLQEAAAALEAKPRVKKAAESPQLTLGPAATPAKNPTVSRTSEITPVPAATSAAAPAQGSAALRKLTIYSDGAARGNPGPAGAGAVIKTPDGRIIASLGQFLGVQTNNVAEYQGLIIALEKALELGAKELDVRADSMLVIMQLRGEWKLKNAGLKPYFDRAKALLGKFEKVSLEHVRRELNGDADEMSNRAIDERM